MLVIVGVRLREFLAATLYNKDVKQGPLALISLAVGIYVAIHNVYWTRRDSI